MFEKNRATALIDDFAHSLPQSAIALTYLLDKGLETVKRIPEEEYEAAVSKQMAQTAERGHVPLMTKEYAMGILRYAKKLAEYEPLDLVVALGNGVYQGAYLRGIYGPGVLVGKAACPYCGGNHFFEDDEDGQERTCADCGSKVDMEELNIEVG